MNREFEGFEEWLEALHKMERDAEKMITPEQRTVTWGSYWMSPRPDLDITIFGYCFSEDELDASEREAGASMSEMRYTHKTISQAHDRGYRYGKAYSVIVPDGEYGSTHISRLWPITKEQFQSAQGHGWQAPLILAAGNGQRLPEAIYTMAVALAKREGANAEREIIEREQDYRGRS